MPGYRFTLCWKQNINNISYESVNSNVFFSLFQDVNSVSKTTPPRHPRRISVELMPLLVSRISCKQNKFSSQMTQYEEKLSLVFQLVLFLPSHSVCLFARPPYMPGMTSVSLECDVGTQQTPMATKLGPFLAVRFLFSVTWSERYLIKADPGEVSNSPKLVSRPGSLVAGSRKEEIAEGRWYRTEITSGRSARTCDEGVWIEDTFR